MFNPKITYFKPQRVPMRHLKIVELTAEEIEAYRLRHINNLEQKEATKKCILPKVPIKEFYIQPIKNRRCPNKWQGN